MIHAGRLADPLFEDNPFRMRVERKYSPPFPIPGGQVPNMIALEVDLFLETPLSLQECKDIYDAANYDLHCISESMAPLLQYTGERSID